MFCGVQRTSFQRSSKQRYDLVLLRWHVLYLKLYGLNAYSYLYQVIFSDADAVLPIITTESEDEDEEESASPEEFFEVEEIFSNVVDGQDRKGNLDTHIVLEENNKVVLE